MLMQTYPEQLMFIWAIITMVVIAVSIEKDVIKHKKIKIGIMKGVWVVLGLFAIVLSMFDFT